MLLLIVKIYLAFCVIIKVSDQAFANIMMVDRDTHLDEFTKNLATRSAVINRKSDLLFFVYLKVNSPIAILYDQITNHFAQGEMGMRLNDAIKSGALNPGIKIDVLNEPIKTPYADLATREIVLQENFLAYLWAICYCFNAFNRMAFEQSIDHDIISLSRSSEAPVINQLFDWAIGLSTAHEDWPQGLPIPGSKNQWCEETDALFLFATRYIMYHEVAHLILHNDSGDLLQRYKNGINSADDRRRFLNMERQADDYAIDSLLNAFPKEPARYMNLLGGAIALLSMFFLRTDDDLRGGFRHPDTDERLKGLMKRARFDLPEHSIFMDYTITTGIQVFLERHRIAFFPENTESRKMQEFEELYQLLFSKVDERKALYEQHRPFVRK